MWWTFEREVEYMFFSTRSIVKNTDARQHNALILIALGNEFVIAPAKAHSLLNLIYVSFQAVLFCNYFCKLLRYVAFSFLNNLAFFQFISNKDFKALPILFEVQTIEVRNRIRRGINSNVIIAISSLLHQLTIAWNIAKCFKCSILLFKNLYAVLTGKTQINWNISTRTFTLISLLFNFQS